jgi:hypothetical protein
MSRRPAKYCGQEAHCEQDKEQADDLAAEHAQPEAPFLGLCHLDRGRGHIGAAPCQDQFSKKHCVEFWF